jgi:hypothetical protein
LNNLIEQSARPHLIHNRLEPLESGRPRHITATLRHYLSLIQNATHRRALSRVLLSSHSFAVEAWRYGDRYYNPVPREQCLCRFGCGCIDTSEHSLLFCTQQLDVVNMRVKLVSVVEKYFPHIRNTPVIQGSIVHRALIFNWETVASIVRLALRTMSSFGKTPLVRPESARKL